MSCRVRRYLHAACEKRRVKLSSNATQAQSNLGLVKILWRFYFSVRTLDKTCIQNTKFRIFLDTEAFPVSNG